MRWLLMGFTQPPKCVRFILMLSRVNLFIDWPQVLLSVQVIATAVLSQHKPNMVKEKMEKIIKPIIS
uniref:Uncharacterized protein n=1 Tax=Anguilla anguilla TaxID=7936 RepID=A0A0E9WXS8_ANGAN